MAERDVGNAVPRCHCDGTGYFYNDPSLGPCSCKPTRTVQLWRMLDTGETIQPGDHYCSSLVGGLHRCTPSMIGKTVPNIYAMPHWRPAGTREESR